jgi:hypothetical protein
MDLAKKFFKLFAGLPRAHGTYVTNTEKKKGSTSLKVEGKGITLYEDVTLEKWEAHLDGTSKGLGIVPIMDDANVWWAAIDVDDYNLDHSELEFKINKAKLPVVMVRSKSGGAHLYVFFKELVTAKLVRSKLQEWVIALGLKPGTEIFPKQIALANKTDVGNWINMPYFDAVNTTRFAIYKNQKLSAQKFIEYANIKAITLSQLEAFSVDMGTGDFTDGPPCLQTLASTGFPQGTRNMGIFNLGVYCRHKYGDDWQPKLEEYNAISQQ